MRCGVHFAEALLSVPCRTAAAPGGFFQGRSEPLSAWVVILGFFIKKFRHHPYLTWPFLHRAREKSMERRRIPEPSKGGRGSSRLSFSSVQNRTNVRPCNYPERRLVSVINPWGGGKESAKRWAARFQLAFCVVPVIEINIQEAAFGSC